MPLHFLYIDENLPAQEQLKKQLNSLRETEHFHACDSLKKAAKYLKENSVDVIIIDPNFTKESGFNFIEKRVHDYFFILHSARTKDAVRGFDIGVFDFMAKPFVKERFSICINRLKEQDYVLQKEKSLLPCPYIEVRCDLMKQRIPHDRIAYVEAMGDYVKIVAEDRKYVVLMSMKKMEDLLPKEQFFRSHKSYIVNTQKIESFTAKEILLKKIKVPLSRFRRQAFIATVQKL